MRDGVYTKGEKQACLPIHRLLGIRTLKYPQKDISKEDVELEISTPITYISEITNVLRKKPSVRFYVSGQELLYHRLHVLY